MKEVERAQAVSVDTSVCQGCDMCALACSLYHTGKCNPSSARLQVAKDIYRYRFTILICQQCEEPVCLDACPVEGAMVQNETGVMSIVDENCIACGRCMEECPYDAIAFHEGLEIYLKCNLCQGRDAGPMCVEVCPTGALSWEGNRHGGEE